MPAVQIIDPLSEEDAFVVFNQLADMQDIAFNHKDGCDARTHIMITRLLNSAYNPGVILPFSGEFETGTHAAVCCV